MFLLELIPPASIDSQARTSPRAWHKGLGMQLSSGAQRLLRTLKSFARLSGRAFPFQKTLAAKLFRTVRTVQRWLAELVRAGLVTVQKRQHSSAEYSLKNVVSDVVSEPQKCRVCPSRPLVSEKIECRGGEAPLLRKPPVPDTNRESLRLYASGFSWRDAVLEARKLLA